MDSFGCQENGVSSTDEKELFLAIANDDPDVIVLRWLRARKWHVEEAVTQILQTMKWRHEWGVADLLSQGESDLSYEEIITGKSFYLGVDRMGRPINYVSVRDHVKGQFSPQSTEKLTVLSMETARKLLRSPIESVTVVFDLTDFALKNMDYQHLKFLIHLLENCYPESVGLALFVNASWIFNRCWSIIKGWLDPVVQNKVHFIQEINELTQFIDPLVLPRRFHGTEPDFAYIPPTDEHRLIFNALRKDHRGKAHAEEIHRQATKAYLRVTRQWAVRRDTKAADDCEEERHRAREHLRDAFEQLTPYVHTLTHYHRCGAIDEPIFHIAYRKIKDNGQ